MRTSLLAVLVVLAWTASATEVEEGMTMVQSHTMGARDVCQLSSTACCNGLTCPHANAVCCPSGKHCCPQGSVCLPSAPGAAPRCGFPVRLHAPRYSACSCPPPPPCAVSPCAPPPCPCSAGRFANAASVALQPSPAAPLAAQIASIASRGGVVPLSLVTSYNQQVAPVMVTFTLAGFPMNGYPVGTPQHMALRSGVSQDVAAALGIAPQQVQVRSVSDAGNGLRVDVEIGAPQAGSVNGQSPTELAKALESMVNDKQSLLRRGQYTMHVAAGSLTSTSEFKTLDQVREERVKAILARRNSRRLTVTAATTLSCGCSVCPCPQRTVACGCVGQAQCPCWSAPLQQADNCPCASQPNCPCTTTVVLTN